MVNITLSCVVDLIAEQFPDWGDLPIKRVEPGGHDNRSFRLGDAMLIRLPSAESYALKVEEEQKWLPILAQNLSLPISDPIAMGRPSKDYPWNWSVYKWIDGQSANLLLSEECDFEHIAVRLAGFLNELHVIDITKDPLLPGQHNWYRGDPPSVYDADAKKYIDELQDIIDETNAMDVWKTALSSQWDSTPVWIHGDLARGNILVKDRKLEAVIDFGGMAVGDPACDLTIAWTLLSGKARDMFKQRVDLDSDTWARARGWALWKAAFELTLLDNKASQEALIHVQIINDVINEYNILPEQKA